MLSLMQVHCYAEEEYEFVSSIYGQYLTYTDNNNWYIKSPDGAVKVSGLYCEAISETRYLILGDNLKYGIADENGKILISFNYDKIQYLRNDLFIVRDQSEWYIIDEQSNVMSLKYENMYRINQNLIAYMLDGLYGVMDLNGNILVDNLYSDIGAQSFEQASDSIIVIENGQYQIIDTNGNIKVKLENKPGILSENLIPYYNGQSWSYIDELGNEKIVLSENVTYAGSFSNGKAIIKTKDMYTYINNNGELIASEYFDVAYDFYNDFAVVGYYVQDLDNNETYDWYIVDESLNKVLDIEGVVYSDSKDGYTLKNGGIRIKDVLTNKMKVLRFDANILDFKYNTEMGVQITEYIGSKTNVIIPSYINGQKVTAISENAFKNNSTIKSISLPNNEITLEANAILSCPNLESVYVPNADTVIIDGAISNCPNVTITGKPASTANIYAITNNITFRATSTQTVRISDVVTDNTTGTVHATVTNTSGKEFNNIQAIVALYSNGKMTDTKTCDIEKLPNNDSVGISVKFNTNNIYEYKIFLWESLQTIKPISDVYVPDGIMKSSVNATTTPSKKYDVSVSNVTTNINAKTISATVKNSGNENISDAVVYVAAYDNGRLLEAQQCDITSFNAGMTQNITATFKTSDIDDYKIFVWDSATTLKPLSLVKE